MRHKKKLGIIGTSVALCGTYLTLPTTPEIMHQDHRPANPPVKRLQALNAADNAPIVSFKQGPEVEVDDILRKMGDKDSIIVSDYQQRLWKFSRSHLEWLKASVKQLAKESRCYVPTLEIVFTDYSNAKAFGLDMKTCRYDESVRRFYVGIYATLMAQTTPAQQKAVLAHEIGHIKLKHTEAGDEIPEQEQANELAADQYSAEATSPRDLAEALSILQLESKQGEESDPALRDKMYYVRRYAPERIGNVIDEYQNRDSTHPTLRHRIKILEEMEAQQQSRENPARNR